MRRLLSTGTGHDSLLWPVLLLLLIVLVPSAGVVWMMRAAMESERLAVRQRLADAYQAQLEIAKDRLDEHWRDTVDRLDAIARDQSPALAFAECVATGACDSAVILDAAGQVAYPAPTPFVATVADGTSDAWTQAERLEFSAGSPREAAAAYQAIAENASDAAVVARARQSQARALVAAGDRDAAIAVLQTLRSDLLSGDKSARGPVADVELRLLQLLNKASREYAEISSSLAGRLNDYGSDELSPDRRRFLQGELVALGAFDARQHAAEQLAAEFAGNPVESTTPNVLEPTNVAGVWQLRSPGGRMVALFTTATLRRTIDEVLARQPLPADVHVTTQGPEQSDVIARELTTVSLAPTMPGWRLAASLADSLPFDVATKDRTALLLWTGVVVVAVTAALALLVARMLRAQSRLARLKNDLVATVSHELKTPLASIRLLVDTLLEADGQPGASPVEGQQAREYLELIARENGRLTRLIDNFLTFSRMERGKNRFDFEPNDAAEIVEQAAAAVAERFDGEANALSIDVRRPLPLVGDADALVTVVVNLLDNAWKYSDDPKRITVTARQIADRVMIAVADNGIGLTPRAARRVFDRFYQVDDRLSRTHGGCGLGLSIVRYIVEAHGGEVTVESRPGAGSTFTVTLLAASATNPEPVHSTSVAAVK